MKKALDGILKARQRLPVSCGAIFLSVWTFWRVVCGSPWACRFPWGRSCESHAARLFLFGLEATLGIALYASRSGTPLEIVSKVLLRHSNLSTTQGNLGKSVMPKRCVGSTICMGNLTYGRAGELTSVRLFPKACLNLKHSNRIPDKSES